MPFPLKRYFTLKELTERWGVPMSEIADYARNSELEVSVMTVALSAELGRIEAGPDGTMLEVREQDTVLFGPQPVLAPDLWSVFGRSVHRIARFKPRTPESYLKVADGCPAVRVTIPELLVTRVERDRFEVANGLVFDDAPPPSRAIEDFVQRSDYAEVLLHGERFLLGKIQAQIVRQLHEAAMTKSPWRTGKQLFANSDGRSTRLVDLFKAKPNWRSLIASDGRGSYRLNLLDHSVAQGKQRFYRRLRLVHTA